MLTDKNWNRDDKRRGQRRCRECQRKQNTAKNPKGNWVSKQVYAWAGGEKKFYSLSSDKRYALRERAAKLYESRHLVDEIREYTKQQAEQIKEGFVYIITNPAWPHWVKIGKAVDPTDRLGGYQTGSPHRDYEVFATFPASDYTNAEQVAHQLFERGGFERSNEWFRIHPDSAERYLRFINFEV